MNTINLISAISVLACNVSMATIPKQANSGNYGDIITIDENITYQKSNSLNTEFKLDNTSYTGIVDRYISSYSNNAINFYSEFYFYLCYESAYHDVYNYGAIYFYTLDIYENTMLSYFQFRPFLSLSNESYSGSVRKVTSFYNSPVSINNLGNTLYFSNYNLGWNKDSDLPLVCGANTGYLPLSQVQDVNVNVDRLSLDWYGSQYNNNGNNGSINFSCDEHIYLTGGSVSNGNLTMSQAIGSLKYKYYINNPTYEVIDLPNVMLSILTMPFTFFSQAFNLTLFPNTPYAINVGHTILIIVGVIGSIYLIRYLVSIFKG